MSVNHSRHYYVQNSCNWLIAARASSYVALTGFNCVRSCNCYSMGIKAIIHSTSLHYGRVSGFSLWANDLLLVYGFIVFCMAWPTRCSHVVMSGPIALWGKFPIFGAFSSSILILNYGRYTFFLTNHSFSKQSNSNKCILIIKVSNFALLVGQPFLL